MLGSGDGYVCVMCLFHVRPSLLFVCFLVMFVVELTFWRSQMNPRNGSKEAAGAQVLECDREGECSVLWSFDELLIGSRCVVQLHPT